ncbi:hypothetical protein JNUCC31_32980 [Paenibacillus sp. JNUCC31]|uniref:hypothetical protein n=1 Tax=Paenibacillus sp. JNUCC-31 TaxID=2777983 RepID=UPI0017868997|nr:hypothetical protein [Paenibacillus sp. JNUCC-31]QOS79396.1 hypothetical protein JNUCC31_32980 [Paenibacillus sp. JNUCC-31]
MDTTQTIINILAWDRGRSDETELASASGEELLLAPGQATVFRLPGVHWDNHWLRTGFVSNNEYSVDLRDWYGLELEAELPLGEPLELTVEIGLLRDKGPLPEELEYVHYHCLLVRPESGINKVVVPFDQFDDMKALAGKWKFVRSVRLLAAWKGESIRPAVESGISIRQLKLRRSRGIHVHAPVLSRSAEAGQVAGYKLELINCTGDVQTLTLTQERYGGETMGVSIYPEACLLEPWASCEVSVQVEVSGRVAPGGHEVQKLAIIPGGRGDLAERIELFTLRALQHPYIKLVEPEWEEVQTKVQEHAWASELLGMYVQRAQQWVLPPVGTGAHLYESHHAHEAENAVIAWKLTGRKDLAEKLVAFLRGVVDPENGYPKTRKACHQELVHEGEFFKHVAVVYDLLFDSGLLNAEDHRNVERTFRLFIELIDWALSVGGISNWTLAEMVGALYCSQALQDMERMNRFLYGIGGYTDHLSKGTLDDGWWYECSVGYNLMAAGLFSEITQSSRPWGINLAEVWVPAQYHDQITPGDKPDIDGLSLDIWGPSRFNYRSITQLWDSLLPFADYRGVLFGINDSAETKMPGISPRGYMDARYDLAYYLFRKPEYADILLTCDLADRDLLYAIPELQPSTSKPYLRSAHADNSGVAMLRSQTEGRDANEQIQAVVKYGSHGGAHGHYDRVSLLSIMRYGRSFYNPENIWYNYHTFMYKFYVQTSITHNMVVVDRKQQDPSEGRLLQFHGGKLFQACTVENEAKWSYPPYGGWRVDGDKTFRERAWNEGRYVPMPEEAPEYSRRTGFTEVVLQRRLTVVTDDYVVLFDYVSGEMEHDYESLFHCKGLVSLEAEQMELITHTEQLDPDPLGSAQFITDCDWYEVSSPIKAHFKTGFGPKYDHRGNRTYHNEDGPLNMDHYTLWPPQFDVIVGNDPEFLEVDKRLFYQVRGDGHVLAEGQFGAWILGRDDLDITVEGIQSLELAVTVEEGSGEHGVSKPFKKTIFWGDPYVENAAGEQFYLADLPLVLENTDSGNGIGVDYYGGPVKIAAKAFPNAVPAEPQFQGQEGIIRVDLTGHEAVRLVASIGGDYPLGDESSRRKLLSSRFRGTSARFVSVIEPYEHQAMIISAAAQSADEIRVELAGGRIQTIRVGALEKRGEAPDLEVELVETDAEGKLLRKENTVIN